MSEEVARRELDRDLAQLAEAETAGIAAFRVWTVDRPVVVVGRSVVVAEEVQLTSCERNGIPIVERPSGGRSVLIGPGTVQYTFALPYSLDEELQSIAGAKTYCNRLLRAGSPELATLDQDTSGDLTRDGRKVAGLALKRGRAGMLLHGTILAHADLDLITTALRHPTREPAYRGGRSHHEFLANLGALDATALARRVADLLSAKCTTS